MLTLTATSPSTSAAGAREPFAALLARVAAFGPISDAGDDARRADGLSSIPAQSRSREDAPPCHQEEPPPVAPVPASGFFGSLGYTLFTLQQPGSLTGMPTLEQALAAPRTERHEERRGTRPRVDAFTMMGEIGFLDI